MIEPRLLKGFRDAQPSEELRRRELVRNLELTFRSFGFRPIDTPALEYADVLLGKGGGETDKQVYRFSDHGDRDVALRFDLTVPFARYMAMHERELPTPFKRYHIGKVWRGENTQRGRYREFMQCDFDIVGIDHVGADGEILTMMCAAMQGLGVEDFEIRVAHRGLFNRFLNRIGASDASIEIMRAVDKLPKIGTAGVRQEVSDSLSREQLDLVLSYVEREGDADDTLAKLTDLAGGANEDADRLGQLLRLLRDTGLEAHVVLDPAITRGLDYYTGIVYETFVTGLEEYGSVCSGGRYNDLASLYTKSHIPGVGASVGLDRLMAALADREEPLRPCAIPQVVVLNLDESLLAHYFVLAARIREAGYPCEVMFQKRKLAQQFARAEKLGAGVALICGEDEHSAGLVNLKNLDTRESFDGLSIEDAISRLPGLLDESS